MSWSRVAFPVVGAVLVPVLVACGASAAPPGRAAPTTGPAAVGTSASGPGPGTRGRVAAAAATVAPGAAGPAVPLVWRTGRDVFGSGLDGSGSRRLLRLPDGGGSPTPSPDGTSVAFLAGGGLRVLRVADGGVRDVGTIRGDAHLLRWSPDGTRVAVPGGDGLVVCTVAPDAPACRRWTGRLAEETGATWNPDGTSIAVVRFPEPARDAAEEQLLAVADGRSTRTIERFRSSADGTRVPQVSAPVWTRAGLVWSVTDVRLEDGELAGIGRIRVRLRAAGRTRTLDARRPSGTTFEAFRPAGETADGTLLGVRVRERRTASTFDLRTLVPGRAPRSAGVALGTLDPGMGNASAEVLGTLADGRVATAVRRTESARFALYLATPGRGAGPVVRRADEVAVATAHPGNPVEE